MNSGRGCIAALSILLAVLASPAVARAAATPIEPPALAQAVADGDLPPVAQRLPNPPLLVDLSGADQTTGDYGGSLRLLMGRQKDTRLLVVYGYARLVGYNRNLELVPDIVESVEVEDQRVFTFRLRENHRWSDGHPFTAEDFRYYWEDVANNEELFRFGPPRALIVDGQLPRFEVLDERTIRYSWPTPNPNFLPALAGARPLFIYRPAHYLKRFHQRYADPKALAALIEKTSARNWAALHHEMDEQYRFDNIDMPTLQPWVNTTRPPSERFVFRRNPYYHRTDGAGHQLPYIDEVVIAIADENLIPAKTGFGESDLQARYIRFDHYTFLKKGEKDNGFEVRLWPTASGAKVALLPNLNTADPVWRDVVRDVRFRRALSLAVDRQAINQVLYFGLARPSADTVLPESPLFEPEYQNAWADFDIDRANALLDEMGLTRTGEGTRVLPDGRPVQIIADTSGESTEESDVLELIKSDWAQIGVELFTKPSQREVFANRVFAGAAVMSIWSGLENGLPTADMSPAELAPTSQWQLQWPEWGEYFETAQVSGQEPDLPAAEELLRLNKDWRYADSTEKRREIWHEMLRIRADQVFSIGTVNSVPQPVVVNRQLRNVPDKAVYSWDPGAFFGIYKPDTFWFDGDRRMDAQ